MIVGLRYWEIKGSRLKAVSWNDLWPAETFQGYCKSFELGNEKIITNPDHKTPSKHCECGIHSLNPAFGRRYYFNLDETARGWASIANSSGNIVFGLISIWGKVIEHVIEYRSIFPDAVIPNGTVTGWRSEFAKILSLWIPSEDTTNIRMIQDFYHVPIYTDYNSFIVEMDRWS